MSTRASTVVEVSFGTPRLGLWCPKCALPTGYECDLVVLTPAGVTTMGTARGCTESDDIGHFPLPPSTTT